MIPASIVNQLQLQIPYIIDGFGGISNFMVYAKEFVDIPIENSRRAVSTSQYQDLINYFHTIFKYENDIIMISPWAMYVDLRDILIEDLTINSINPDYPYQVYDIRGNLKYTVTGHLGIFGESRLDENLVNKSKNGGIYYLKYRTYNGTEKVKLIIINLFSREVRASNKNFKSPLTIINSTFTIVKNSIGSINTYFVSGPPVLTTNIDVNNYRRQEALRVLSPETPVYLSIKEGGWLLIDHNGIDTQRTTITNTSNDIVIEVATDPTFVLYYVGLNVDVSTLNQYYTESLVYTNRPITEIITVN